MLTTLKNAAPESSWPLLAGYPDTYPDTKIELANTDSSGALLDLNDVARLTPTQDPFDAARSKRRTGLLFAGDTLAPDSTPLLGAVASNQHGHTRGVVARNANATEELDASCILEVLDLVTTEAVDRSFEPKAAKSTGAPHGARPLAASPAALADDSDEVVAVSPVLTPVPFASPEAARRGSYVAAQPLARAVQPVQAASRLSLAWWGAAGAFLFMAASATALASFVLGSSNGSSAASSTGASGRLQHEVRGHDGYARTLRVRHNAGVSVDSLRVTRGR
jgi:hypothetical protein